MKKLFVLIILLWFSITNVHANSALHEWEGKTSTGAIITDEDNPIEVTQEILTFHIPEYPDFFDDSNAVSHASVTAEYTFYNPEAFTVTARLMFPFGNCPSYLDNETNLYNFEIAVDGVPVDKQLRHTYCSDIYNFDVYTDLARLSDAFCTDEYYTDQLTVTEYTVRFSDVDTMTYPNARFLIAVDHQDNRKIHLSHAENIHNDDQTSKIGKSASSGDEVTFILFGEPFTDLPITFYSNGGCKDIIEGSAEIIEAKTSSLKEFIMKDYDENSGILVHDWYNAYLDMLKDNTGHSLIHTASLNFDYNLMRWYDYTLEIAPESSVVNVVTAPIYPTILTNYDPYIYKSTYLLSPARTWKSFGHLKIEIITDYVLKSSTLSDFQKTDQGYILEMESLPEDELSFQLCEIPNPKLKAYSFNYGMFIVTIFLQFVIPVSGIVLLIMFFVKSRITDKR